MKIVVDANILFSALIQHQKTHLLLVDERLELYTPAHIFREYNKHKETLLYKTQRRKKEFLAILNLIQEQLIVTKPKRKHIEYAKTISPDDDDSPYLALAIELGCPLWSNDKRLKEQSVVHIYNTGELINALDIHPDSL